MTRAFVFAALCLLSLPTCASQFKLTEVNGSECVPGMIYDKSQTAAELRSELDGKVPGPNVTNFIALGCADDEPITVGINSTAYKLSKDASRSRSKDEWYLGEKIAVNIVTHALILDYPSSNSSCGGQWYSVDVKVIFHRRTRHIKGTLQHSC